MLKTFRLAALGLILLLSATAARAAEKPQEWELINPTGAIKLAQVDPAKRITTLEGKTVALRWNGKHNGNVVLDRIAEHLAKEYPNTKVIKTYVEDPSLNCISGTPANSARITAAVASVKPDLVIAAQGD